MKDLRFLLFLQNSCIFNGLQILASSKILEFSLFKKSFL
nr:MAG TPA: hypothetical protein [Caudoviricetes sp.]